MSSADDGRGDSRQSPGRSRGAGRSDRDHGRQSGDLPDRDASRGRPWMAVRGLGFEPFVVAAMGSHGGGTAEGQRALLAELGVTEAALGCPIRSEMDTVEVGTNSFGLPIHFDRNAYEADGIILLNRIKPHTSFTGRYESGLLKMLTIGLGKRQGAAQVHKLGLPGLRAMLPEVGAFLLRRTRVVLGVAILENAREHTARIVAVEPEELLEVEPRLLDEARSLMAGSAVRPDRRPGRRRAGQELQRDRAGPERDRPPAGRDDARPAPAGDHPPGGAGPLGRDAGQCPGDRPGRPDHRAAGAPDRPDADAGQQHDEQLPDAGPGPAFLADRSRRASRLASTPAGGPSGEQARMVIIPNTLELTVPVGHSCPSARSRPSGAAFDRLRHLELRDRFRPDRPFGAAAAALDQELARSPRVNGLASNGG